MKTKSWNELISARIDAGLFFGELKNVLGTSDRTLARWKKKDAVPVWAVRILELLSGDLEPLGWKDWELKNGYLCHKNLSDRHFWLPVDVLVTAFCDCTAHREAAKARSDQRLRPQSGLRPGQIAPGETTPPPLSRGPVGPL